MKAMVLDKISTLEEDSQPLSFCEMEDPSPGAGEVLIHVSACGVCHTELDEIEGRTPPSRFPMILGHQVVGKIVASGTGAKRFRAGDRVGVAWIFSACGSCKFCRGGNENLCADFRGTGRDVNGGYAEFMTAREEFCYPYPGISPTPKRPRYCVPEQSDIVPYD